MNVKFGSPKQEYDKCRKKHGEFLNEIFYRPLAFPFVMLAKLLRISPNLVSVFAFILTVLSGVFLVMHEYMLAGIMFFSRHVFDNVDGSLARNLQKFSKAGACFDAVCDALGFLVATIGLMYSQYSISGETTIIAWSVLLLASMSLQVVTYDNFRGRFIRPLQHSGEVCYEIFNFQSGRQEEKNKNTCTGRILAAANSLFSILSPVAVFVPDKKKPDKENKKAHADYLELYRSVYPLLHKLWSLVAGTVITTLFALMLVIRKQEWLWFIIIVVMNCMLVIIAIINNILFSCFRSRMKIAGITVSRK
ncbi:MAG: CDP-alcohol phosphatidyltransferase family protein [Spirochaetales bacterium]|nr:CDP-alcohol phosphatidyltransferase family protein [Spirochaetales bacterium]